MSRRTIPIKDLNKVTSVDPDDEFALQLKNGSPAVAVKARHLPTATEEQLEEIFRALPVVTPDSECYVIGLCGDDLVRIPVDEIPPDTNTPPDIILTASAWWKDEGLNFNESDQLTTWENSGTSGSILDLNVTGNQDTATKITVNGIDAIRHEEVLGNGERLVTSGHEDFGTPFTLVFVGKYNKNPRSVDEYIFSSKDAGYSANLYITGSVDIDQQRYKMQGAGGTLTYDVEGSVDIDSPHVWIAEYTGGANATLTISSVGDVTGDIGVDTYRCGMLFNNPSFAVFAEMDMYEGLVIGSGITAQQKADIISYYETRFDFGLP